MTKEKETAGSRKDELFYHSRKKTVLVGFIGVDSGSIVLGDITEGEEARQRKWDIEELLKCGVTVLENYGGVKVTSGPGDGIYPVFVEYDSERNEVSAVRVEFDPLAGGSKKHLELLRTKRS